MKRLKNPDGLKPEHLESLRFILAFPDRLTHSPEFLSFVSQRWERSARAHCGTPFIPQSLLNPCHLGPELNTTTDTSLKRM